MEFAEACMQAMLWHGRDMGWGLFDGYLDSEEYKANADRAIKAYFKIKFKKVLQITKAPIKRINTSHKIPRDKLYYSVAYFNR
jgi:hypothetical protein